MNEKGLGIKQFYKGKTILITGCTGFVGKVVLEMIMRKTEFRCIYVMIRHKQGSTLEKRMYNEIFKSRLFEPLYEARPDMLKIIKEQVVPISGDLVIEKLGLDPKVRKELTENLDIIMNIAASVNFEDPIHDAL